MRGGIGKKGSGDEDTEIIIYLSSFVKLAPWFWPLHQKADQEKQSRSTWFRLTWSFNRRGNHLAAPRQNFETGTHVRITCAGRCLFYRCGGWGQMTCRFLTLIVWVGPQAGFWRELPSDRLTLPRMMSRRLCCLFFPRSVFISISFCKRMVKNLRQRIRAHITTALVFPGVLLQNVFILLVKTFNN